MSVDNIAFRSVVVIVAHVTPLFSNSSGFHTKTQNAFMHGKLGIVVVFLILNFVSSPWLLQ